MAGVKTVPVQVLTRGFSVWKAAEAKQNRRIPMDAIIAETGLAQRTVRRYLVADGADVTGATLASAATLADYFGVSLNELVEIRRVDQSRS